MTKSELSGALLAIAVVFFVIGLKEWNPALLVLAGVCGLGFTFINKN